MLKNLIIRGLSLALLVGLCVGGCVSCKRNEVKTIVQISQKAYDPASDLVLLSLDKESTTSDHLRFDKRFDDSLSEYSITSSFGYRTDVNVVTSKFHTGVDLAMPVGTSLLAPIGASLSSGEDSTLGKYVVLDAGDYKILFAHMSETPQKALVVSRGSIIGLSGNTGNSTGPHCHVAVSVKDVFVDPVEFFRDPDIFVKAVEHRSSFGFWVALGAALTISFLGLFAFFSHKLKKTKWCRL